MAFQVSRTTLAPGRLTSRNPLLALKIVDHVLQTRAKMARGVAAIHQVQSFDQKLARLLQELVRRRAGGFVRAVHLKSPFPKF